MAKNGYKWACFGYADDGGEMLMGWECDTRSEAEEIRADVIWHRDLPAGRLRVRRLNEEGRDAPVGGAALRDNDRKGPLRSSSLERS